MAPMRMGGGVSLQYKGLYEHFGVSANKIMAPMSIFGGSAKKIIAL